MWGKESVWSLLGNFDAKDFSRAKSTRVAVGPGERSAAIFSARLSVLWRRTTEWTISTWNTGVLQKTLIWYGPFDYWWGEVLGGFKEILQHSNQGKYIVLVKFYIMHCFSTGKKRSSKSLMKYIFH